MEGGGRIASGTAIESNAGAIAERNPTFCYSNSNITFLPGDKKCVLLFQPLRYRAQR
jgi:hypothetical protein